MHEQELRKHRCCFTGHRPEKLNISEEQLCVRLGQEIDQAIEDGFTTFISGMAKGVDICAAELVLKRRVSDARLKLICALPYENFGLHWSASWTDRYVEVIWHADMVRCISQEFSYSAYQRRNEWMVDHSGRVIAVYTGESGGTRNTIAYAKQQHIPCVIITPYITNVDFGRGLIKCGSAIVPFMDNFPKHTQLYQWMTTKPSDLTV